MSKVGNDSTYMFILIIGFGLLALSHMQLIKKYNKEIEQKEQTTQKVIGLEKEIGNLRGCPLTKGDE